MFKTGILFIAAAFWLRSPVLRAEEPEGGSATTIPSGRLFLADLCYSELFLQRPVLLERELPSPATVPALAERADGIDASYAKKIDERWAMFTSQMTVRDTGSEPESPLSANKWHTNDLLRLKVAGPLMAFGELGAACDCMESQDVKFTGKTGLSCRLQPLPSCEIQLRGGPSVTYADPLRPERTKEQSDLLLELQCRCPLPAKAKLEYDTSALPAVGTAERDRVNQDLRLAFPLGTSGIFRVGAKHSWENTPTARPWTDGMQVYIGVDLRR
jgi:hypothetical protein